MRHPEETIATPATSAEQHSQPHEERVARAVPAWLISAAVHGLALGLMSLIVYATTPISDEPAITPMQIPPREPEPVVIHDPIDPQTHPTPTLQVPEEAKEYSPHSELVASDEQSHRESDLTALDEGSEGETTAVADSAMANTGFALAIGPGANAASLYSARRGFGKETARRRWGGPRHAPARDNAIDAALRWFKKHQSPNGQWDVDGYQANCQDAGAKCEPGTAHTGADGDLACTAYAVLCYLGAGHDHRTPGKYRKTVLAALDYLVAAQKADGLWGERNYEHAIVAMALAEAYGMSTDPKLREPAQKGIAIILSRQAKDGAYGLGWDYGAANPARIDASVSGWNIMALKSAKASGLDVGMGLEGSATYLDRAWKAANPGLDATKLDPYQGTSVFPYVWNSVDGSVQVEPGATQHDLSCVGALCAVFLGHKASDPVLNSLANHIERTQYPTAYPTNTYYLYYNSMVMFQLGAERFTRWNQPVVDLLTTAQRSDGCHQGSWDFTGTVFHGHETGRLLSTAYSCLTLEVIYRNTQILAH